MNFGNWFYETNKNESSLTLRFLTLFAALSTMSRSKGVTEPDINLEVRVTKPYPKR